MTDKKRPSDKVEDHAQQDSGGSVASPRPPKQGHQQPQFFLPFAPESGTVVVSDREQLHALLSSLPIILFVLDGQAKFKTLEGRGLTVLPPSQHSLVGCHFFELYPQNSETRRHLAQALDGTVVSWKGSLGDHVFMTTLTPLRGREASVTGLLGIGIEASDAVEARGSMASDDQSVTEESPVKNQFFARVSHELRAPLNSVVAFANLLLKNSATHFSEQDLSYMYRILSNATHLLGVVGDMMDLTVFETGRAKIALSEVDLAELIQETISEIGVGVKREFVEMGVEIPDNARSIETDRQKLKQVLINLLANALKFTQQGSVTISVTVDEFLRPVRIDVRDTGVGIPADKLDAVFEAFERGEQAAGQDIEGTGLGLTISQTLCRLMGYTIRVASESGKGSTFTIDMSQTPTATPARQS